MILSFSVGALLWTRHKDTVMTEATLTWRVLRAQRRSGVMGRRTALQCARRGPGEGEVNSGLVVMGGSQEGFPEEVVVEVLKAEEVFARQRRGNAGDGAQEAKLAEL